MANLTLLGELGRRLSIVVHGYEREAALDPHDANWLRCSADVEQGSFRGAVNASFATSDFERFLFELNQVMTASSGSAIFETMEEALTFRVDVDRAGRASVTGDLRDVETPGIKLSFAFDTDRSFLKATHSDVERLVAKFPVRIVGT